MLIFPSFRKENCSLQTVRASSAKTTVASKGWCLRRRYLGQYESAFILKKIPPPEAPILAVMRHWGACEGGNVQKAARGDGGGDDMGAIAHAH